MAKRKTGQNNNLANQIAKTKRRIAKAERLGRSEKYIAGLEKRLEKQGRA